MTECIGWTDERVEKLKADWKAGFSCSQIACRLGGVTRNGVIGKVHRLGLSGRAPRRKIALIPKQKQERKPRPRKPSLLLSVLALPPPRLDDIARVSSIVDLKPHHCKYPVGEPTKGFCGLNRHPGSPYCTGHSHLCFRVAEVVPRRPQLVKKLEAA